MLKKNGAAFISTIIISFILYNYVYNTNISVRSNTFRSFFKSGTWFTTMIACPILC
jgi:hypothetical protein